MLIAQISDTHIAAEGELAYGRVDTAAYTARVVAHVQRLDPAPDVVLVTGDLVEHGTAEQYRHLQKLLAPLSMPLFLIPGNHDDREGLREVFTEHAYLPPAGLIQYVVDGYPLRLVALDTVITGQSGGLMDDERLAWLEARLAEAPARPTAVLMHHPPFATGLTIMDGMGLRNADAMAAVIVRHRQVEAVLCGHLHRPIHTRWAGTVVTTAPGVAHQVALDLRPAGDLAIVMEPPAILLHAWRAGHGLVTHTSYIGDYGVPHRVQTSAS
jgi:3',5'-cyclic AMP phosphodiesterase CpdA